MTLRSVWETLHCSFELWLWFWLRGLDDISGSICQRPYSVSSHFVFAECLLCGVISSGPFHFSWTDGSNFFSPKLMHLTPVVSSLSPCTGSTAVALLTLCITLFLLFYPPVWPYLWSPRWGNWVLTLSVGDDLASFRFPFSRATFWI